MEPWQRGGRSKFSGTQEQKQSGVKLQSWQREPGKFSAENAWYTLKKDVVEEKFKACLADWQKANKHDDTSSKDTFTLVIGNEVNLFDKVYRDHVYYLGESGQTGHSFFYVTKNSKVYSAFSFGPANHEHYITQINEGTADYEIGQVFRFHRFSITKEQAIKIKKQVDIFRGKVNEPTLIDGYSPAPYGGMIKMQVSNPNKMYYNPVFGNYTCAAEARAVLELSGIHTPKGKGRTDVFPDAQAAIQSYIFPKNSFLSDQKSPLEVVNPYEWYHNIVQKYGEGELYKGVKPENYLEKDGFSFKQEMKILEGDEDPLIATKQNTKILHLQ